MDLFWTVWAVRLVWSINKSSRRAWVSLGYCFWLSGTQPGVLQTHIIPFQLWSTLSELAVVSPSAQRRHNYPSMLCISSDSWTLLMSPLPSFSFWNIPTGRGGCYCSRQRGRMCERINKGEVNMEMSSSLQWRLGSCLDLGNELSSHIQLCLVSGASLSIWKTKLCLIISIRFMYPWKSETFCR